ncbi:MAG: type II CAAX endopeptidase family protein [Terriglobia bacterium]|jgi:membrane protease YdiL (CAAX protease family)
MNSTGIFIGDDCLRPVWRFFLSVVLLVAAFMVSTEMVGAVFLIGKVHPSLYVALFWQSLASLVAIVASYKLMTAVFDRRPLGSVGLALHPRWWRELGRGLMVGAAMLFFATVLEEGCGFAHFTFSPHPMMRAGSFSFMMFAVAAANEEAIFRGYPFQRLTESITPVGAIVATSTLFGLAHLSNPHRTWVSTLNTALIGVPFAVAYLRTRSLWMPIGIHFTWNFLLGFLLGLPVSGLTIPASVFAARVRGPVWLTGGEYGPEGGLLVTGAILLVTVYVSLAKSIYTSEEMKALVFAPATQQSPDPPITIFSASPAEETKKDRFP